MLHPELFKQLESVRWDKDKDIPWSPLEAAEFMDEQMPTSFKAAQELNRYRKNVAASLSGGVLAQTA